MDSAQAPPVSAVSTVRPAKVVLSLVFVAPLLATVTASVFNIWYNVEHINPLLTPSQNDLFQRSILWLNLIVYPVLMTVWYRAVFRMKAGYDLAVLGATEESRELVRARKRAINLPWHAGAICGIGWLICIPFFITVLRTSPEPIDTDFKIHLPVSILISGMISITHGFFLVELLAQEFLFPVLFRDAKPSQTPGTLILSLRLRGLLWALSVGACPILSLVLLGMIPDADRARWFAPAVGGLGVLFGILSAWMLGRLVARPIEALHHAAHRMAHGDLQVRVDLLRADEFGPLIDSFNHMVAEMREKQIIRETFGAHVGQEVAREILARDPGLGGVVQEITVMFCDIRNFTARSAISKPDEMVALLNRFFEGVVALVEEDQAGGERGAHGVVNQILGDGFMALFGVGRRDDNHAQTAVRVAVRMLEHMKGFNAAIEAEGRDPIKIGIGINTGPALVGSIGSPQRMQYTAIGDTTNLAARVEGLTKTVGEPLLFTRATRDQLPEDWRIKPSGEYEVKGQPKPVEVFTTSEIV
jgi:adenylate cyclase